MFVTEAHLDNNWTSLASIVGGTIEEDVLYIITNSSQTDRLYAVESSGTPAQGIQGIPFDPEAFLRYVKGDQDLYLRNGATVSTNGSARKSRITIHKKG